MNSELVVEEKCSGCKVDVSATTCFFKSWNNRVYMFSFWPGRRESTNGYIWPLTLACSVLSWVKIDWYVYAPSPNIVEWAASSSRLNCVEKITTFYWSPSFATRNSPAVVCVHSPCRLMSSIVLGRLGSSSNRGLGSSNSTSWIDPLISSILYNKFEVITNKTFNSTFIRNKLKILVSLKLFGQ